MTDYTYEVTDTGKYFYENNVRIFPEQFWQIIKKLEYENKELKKELILSKPLYSRRQLEKENKQLKADNNRLVNETAKVVAEHQSKVFKLIDEKIDELEGRYKFGQEVYRGCPMHNIRFGINVLKELKKELQE